MTIVNCQLSIETPAPFSEGVFSVAKIKNMQNNDSDYSQFTVPELKDEAKDKVLLHFKENTVTISKERYFRLLEIEAQYNAQKEETSRLHQ